MQKFHLNKLFFISLNIFHLIPHDKTSQYHNSNDRANSTLKVHLRSVMCLEFVCLNSNLHTQLLLNSLHRMNVSRFFSNFLLCRHRPSNRSILCQHVMKSFVRFTHDHRCSEWIVALLVVSHQRTMSDDIARGQDKLKFSSFEL